MEAHLFSYNAVVVASIFNPSRVRDGFLRQHHVLLPDEQTVQPTTYSDVMALVATQRVQFTVSHQQLLVAPQGEGNAAGVVRDVALPLIRAMSEIPLTAVGINFVWNVDPQPTGIAALTRRLFAPGGGPFAAEFSSADVHFGGYFSRDLGDDVRMKLDIKPLKVKASEPGVPLPPGLFPDMVQLNFNFHADIAEGPSDGRVARVAKVLSRWEEFDGIARRLVDGVTI